MLGRLIIASIGAGFAVYCVLIAFLTYFEKNPATLHLRNFYLIGYAAINAVLTPFGISGVVGGLSRKKSLIKAFTRFQWWLATFILIGLNVFNVIRSKNDKRDFIRRCQSNLTKSQPESISLARCTAIVDDAEKVTFIAACSQSGIMIFLGIILVIVGTRVYSSISLEEETKNLLEKANFKEIDERDKIGGEPRNTSDANNNGSNVEDSMNINHGSNNIVNFIPEQYDTGRYPPNNITNVRRQPSNPIKATTANVELVRRPTNANNMNAMQHSGIRRNPTDPSSMPPSYIGRKKSENNFMPPSYTGLARHPTNPGTVPSKGYNGLARYPTNGSNISVNRANITRQPTIGNTYVPRNYVGAPQATYPIVSQHSLSIKKYTSPSPPYAIPPQQTSINNIVSISEMNNYGDYDPYNSNTHHI